jgi:hypothetical protein
MFQITYLFVFIIGTASVKFDGKFYDCMVFNEKQNFDLNCSTFGSEAKRFGCEALENALVTASNNNKQFNTIHTPAGSEIIFYTESKLV